MSGGRESIMWMRDMLMSENGSKESGKENLTLEDHVTIEANIRLRHGTLHIQGTPLYLFIKRSRNPQIGICIIYFDLLL